MTFCYLVHEIIWYRTKINHGKHDSKIVQVNYTIYPLALYHVMCISDIILVQNHFKLYLHTHFHCQLMHLQYKIISGLTEEKQLVEYCQQRVHFNAVFMCWSCDLIILISELLNTTEIILTYNYCCYMFHCLICVYCSTKYLLYNTLIIIVMLQSCDSKF